MAAVTTMWEDEAASSPPMAGLPSRGLRAQPQEETAPTAKSTPEALAFNTPADDLRAQEPWSSLLLLLHQS